MDPALIGARLAGGAIAALLKKLLVSDGPGAGILGQARRVRLSGLVSFRGEKRTLTEEDVRHLAADLVERAATGPGEPPFPADETEAVTDALAATLLALGDLDMDDVQAVHLGHHALAQRLRAAAPSPDGLAADSVLFVEAVTEEASRHILEFFTERSTFVPRTLVEQTRSQAELNAKTDTLLSRVPHPDVRDAEFERRYLAHLAKKHGRLTIYGIDLHHSPDEWPLDTAYLSLEATDTGLIWDRWQLNQQALGLREPGPAGLPADRALTTHPRILLRGLAGSGKTTLVQWLTLAAATQARCEGMDYIHGRIPFVLPLRTLTRYGPQLPDAEHFLSAAGCPLTAPTGWVDRVLAAGRGLVLVDGIDEIPEFERGRTRDWLCDLVTAYENGNRWLVTSRPSAVRDDWLRREGFTELTLSPMSPAEVTSFVRRWHQAAGPEAAPYEQPLLNALRTTEDVPRLATNPLMCGLICALHRDRRGFLPRRRKALYEAALSMLLSRRDRERDMGAPYGIELSEASQIQLIQRLAYWLTVNGRTQMPRDRARTMIAEAIDAIPEAAAYDNRRMVFTHLLHRSGLLREPTEDTIEFVHRTFQDFLAAKHLVDRWDIGVLVNHAGDDQWDDVIRMALSHARPRECDELLNELLRAARDTPHRHTEVRILALAVSSLDQVTEVDPHVQQWVLVRAARIVPPRTMEEAQQLGQMGGHVLDLLPAPDGLCDQEALLVVTAASHIAADAAIGYLAQFAGHPSLQVRSQLIWSWTRFDTRAYGEEVVARLAPNRLRYFVAGDEQAEELLRLGLRPALLEISEHVSDEVLARLLTTCNPRLLRLRRGGLRPDLSALTGLARLESLTLGLHPEAAWSLADLPTGAPLDHLQMPEVWPRDGLEPLGRFSVLTSLNLWNAPALEAAMWPVLATLSTVRTLAVAEGDLTPLPRGITMDAVRTLRLLGRGAPPRARVAALFPFLERLEHATRTGA
ncbi:NACHT domain-containing protein [Streptomyces sp. NPDC048350]|uniref:NACHT domain-containing protein n=1 Tax=Streptomyces sp. NPDC048350 TaxID=3365538 RepID=UPI00371E1A63